MKALISPNEYVYSNTGELLGSRVAEISENEFPVALPLFWVDVDVSIIDNALYYADGQVKVIQE